MQPSFFLFLFLATRIFRFFNDCHPIPKSPGLMNRRVSYLRVCGGDSLLLPEMNMSPALHLSLKTQVSILSFLLKNTSNINELLSKTHERNKTTREYLLRFIEVYNNLHEIPALRLKGGPGQGSPRLSDIDAPDPTVLWYNQQVFCQSQNFNACVHIKYIFKVKSQDFIRHFLAALAPGRRLNLSFSV